MKKLLTIGTYIMMLGAISACNKTTEMTAKYDPVTSSQALIKFNYVSNYLANPGVQIKLNDTRVTPLLTARTPFPGGGYNTGGDSRPDYLPVTPGNVSLTVAIPKAGTATDSIVLFNTALTLEGGKNYTAHITDTAANTKILLLQDDLTRPDTGQTRFRFVNLMPNVPSVDLYYGTEKVASNVGYLTATNYITMPVPATAATWAIREAGAAPTSTALATYSSANTTLSQRIYTAFALGYKGETNANRRPYISFLLNR